MIHNHYGFHGYPAINGTFNLMRLLMILWIDNPIISSRTHDNGIHMMVYNG